MKTRIDFKESEEESLAHLQNDIIEGRYVIKNLWPQPSTLLHELAAVKNPYIPIKMMQYLIDNGADINAEDEKYRTLLHIATKEKLISIMKFLLNNGANIEAYAGVKICTPIFKAIKSRDSETLKLLLEYGASLDARDQYNHTPFLRAAQTGSLECMKLLLDYKADINATGYSDKSALYLTIANAHEGACRSVNFLIKNGAKIFTQRVYPYHTPFHIVYNSFNIEESFKIIKSLLKIATPEEIDAIDRTGHNILTSTFLNFGERYRNQPLDEYVKEYVKIIKTIIHHMADEFLIKPNAYFSIIKTATSNLDAKSFIECFIENPDISSGNLQTISFFSGRKDIDSLLNYKQLAEDLFYARGLKIRETNEQSIPNSYLSLIIEKSNNMPSFNSRIVQLFKNYKEISNDAFKDGNSSTWLNNYIKTAFILRKNGLNELTIKKILKSEIIDQFKNEVYSDNNIGSIYLKFVNNENAADGTHEVELSKDCVLNIISFLEPEDFIQAIWLYPALAHRFSEAQDLNNFEIQIIGEESNSLI